MYLAVVATRATGDGGIPNPYFYVTAYPTPEGWTNTQLPTAAYWQLEGWTGAVLPYAEVAGSDDGKALLLNFLKLLQKAGSDLMV